MRILFFGYLHSVSETSWQRYDTLRRMGYDVIPFDQSILVDFTQRRVLRRVDGHAFKKKNIEHLNVALRSLAKEYSPELIWIEKGLTVQPETLIEIKALLPNSLLISFQDDNPFGARHYERAFWTDFIRCIPCYDIHLVKRDSDLAEFRQRGAKDVALFTTGYYDPIYNSRYDVAPSSFLHDISFVGTAFDNRAAVATGLLWNGRFDAHFYGSRWNRCVAYYTNRKQFHGWVPLSRYADLIWQTRINLGFVSSSNHDAYNGRSFDITAGGGLFLAERTDAHQSFYKEDVEAVFFGSSQELQEKITFYLKHEDSRRQIAAAGRRRALRSDYALSARLSATMKWVKSRMK